MTKVCWLLCFMVYQPFSGNSKLNQVILMKVCLFQGLRIFKYIFMVYSNFHTLICLYILWYRLYYIGYVFKCFHIGPLLSGIKWPWMVICHYTVNLSYNWDSLFRVSWMYDNMNYSFVLKTYGEHFSFFLFRKMYFFFYKNIKETYRIWKEFKNQFIRSVRD